MSVNHARNCLQVCKQPKRKRLTYSSILYFSGAGLRNEQTIIRQGREFPTLHCLHLCQNMQTFYAVWVCLSAWHCCPVLSICLFSGFCGYIGALSCPALPALAFPCACIPFFQGQTLATLSKRTRTLSRVLCKFSQGPDLFTKHATYPFLSQLFTQLQFSQIFWIAEIRFSCVSVSWLIIPNHVLQHY